jgi:hypothetical protein
LCDNERKYNEKVEEGLFEKLKNSMFPLVVIDWERIREKELS